MSSDKSTVAAPGAMTHFGEEIARLRTRRGWSRTKLVAQLYSALLQGEDSDIDTLISESWLMRLESGRVVKISRQIVEALAAALRCTPRERARLLLYADRNVLADPNDKSNQILEVYHFVMQQLYAETSEFLVQLLNHRCVQQLNDEELAELCYAALSMVIRERQERLKQTMHK